ncbi:MAG: DUF2225 domain-containing protein [Gemmatimonadota bacterium]|nr:DUF2225 domain-containing protein [Gemmatimonadota bacterium]
MTTLDLIELACPICTSAFRSQTVVTTNAFGGKRTDFHERAAGMQPLPYFVHLCTTCGFAGVERDFREEIDLAEELRERVMFELTPVLARETATGSLKYEHAALVAGWQGAEPRYLADLYLRAAWCCVDENDTEAERYFRRHAAWRFTEALAAYEGVPTEERPVLTYLVGELWRRVGDQSLANSWFERVPLEITDAASQSWVVEMATQQRGTPKEWFA